MLSAKYRPYHVPLFLAKYAWLGLRKMPVLVHFEVTLRCNARCSFCDYWKTDASAKATELTSFTDAAKRFNPMLVTWTGGEPTLRKDLEDLVAGVDRAIDLKYTTLITHGAMLTPERARSLWQAGIDQFNISLDYLDERHDQARGIPGLVRRILDTTATLRERGVNVRFNTVIKNDNLDQLLPIVQEAQRLRAGVNFSVYTDLKNGNGAHRLGSESQAALEAVIADLLAFKRRRRGVITNSDYYLETIPQWTRGAMREPCQSGLRTIHIDPVGHVKRCPDFPTDFHWKDFRRYEPIRCDKCYYACRGEAQAPLRPSRVLDVLGSA
ncbi:MAG: radical SAM protein [Gemmatimonadaceae bacterium]|nr:radical SAM protein [Gemmatimonadaceae bacterium]